MSTNEGFGPRFRRLREKVDEWAKGYDERRAADKAFLERDKKRVEEARAAYKASQGKVKQRVKVFGNAGAKSTETVKNTPTQTVEKETPVKPKFKQNNATNYAWTDFDVNGTPVTTSKSKSSGKWDGYTDEELDAYGKRYNWFGRWVNNNTAIGKAYAKREDSRKPDSALFREQSRKYLEEKRKRRTYLGIPRG